MRVVALTFHDIAGDGGPRERAPLDDAKAALSRGGAADPQAEGFSRITAEELEQVLLPLRHRGYQTVSSRAFRAWQGGSKALPERALVLTFDHGYASHFGVATSLLLRHHFSGTFFVTVERIGRPGYMTWDELRKLVFLGMEIGSRGLSPEPFNRLSRPQLDESLAASKQLLEQRLGIPVRALAAPDGWWSQAVAEAAQRAGYDAVWASTVGTNGRETNAQALRRIVVRRPFSADRIVAMVEGWQPSFWWAANQQLLIRSLKRVLGVYWYEQLKRRLVPNA